MQDMKLVEALNDLRDEVRRQGVELRGAVLQQSFRLLHKALWAVVLLGLALGGKDLLAIVLKAVP